MLLELFATGARQTALAPVPAKDLMALLDGVVLQHGEVVVIAGGEYYGPDGRFAVGDRAPRMGHWRAGDGRICNWTWPDRRDERCTVVMTDGQGRIYTEGPDSEPYEIRFVPVLTSR